MPSTKDVQKALMSLIDPAIPLKHRQHQLLYLLHEGGDLGQAVVKSLLEAAARSNGQALVDKKLKDLAALKEEMQSGPLRTGTFLEMVRVGGSQRAKVLLGDGDTAFTTVPDADLAGSLMRGEPVLLEARGRALLGRDASGVSVGEEARFERRIDDRRVEVMLRDREPNVYWASQYLADQLDAGEVAGGARVLVDPRRNMALEAVRPPDGLAAYWYLERQPVPDVIVERDLGCPPAFLDELTEHLRAEMTAPGLGRRYRQRRFRTKLLTGVSGTGKSFAILAFWRRMYEVMSEVTGAAIDELPCRVLWLRLGRVLSKWYGEAEQRLSRFFDELEQLAAEKFRCPDGREIELPVLAVFEEMEGLARARGTGDAITERVQTTALERLDANNPRLRDRLAVFFCTTNVPSLVDPAFLRRAGGTSETFGRLDRRGFTSVLSKHLRELPFRADYGPQRQAERRAAREVSDWLYSRNGQDEGQVQITYIGSTEPDVRYRRDLLTAALVDRAVQEAAGEACLAERAGLDEPGLDSERIVEALDRQVRSIVDQLTRDNVGNYINLPEGARVADVRRLARSAPLPVEMERIG